MSKSPVVARVAWISLIPHLLIFAFILAAVSYVGSGMPFHRVMLFSALAYLTVSKGVRFLILKDHRQGVALVNQGRYSEAIPLFKSQYDFLTKHKWLDNWRYVVLLSSTAIPYRELALHNIAFCYGQMGDAEKSRAWWERTLEQFPESLLARNALRMADTFEGRTPSQAL